MTLATFAFCLSLFSLVVSVANFAFSLGRQSGYKAGLAAAVQGNAGDNQAQDRDA